MNLSNGIECYAYTTAAVDQLVFQLSIAKIVAIDAQFRIRGRYACEVGCDCRC